MQIIRCRRNVSQYIVFFTIQKFLLMEVRVLTQAEPLNKTENGIKVTNLCGKWNSSSEEMTLSNISFEVKPGQLVAIIGTVGAAKVRKTFTT